jgi:hypothetical protein
MLKAHHTVQVQYSREGRDSMAPVQQLVSVIVMQTNNLSPVGSTYSTVNQVGGRLLTAFPRSSLVVR